MSFWVLLGVGFLLTFLITPRYAMLAGLAAVVVAFVAPISISVYGLSEDAVLPAELGVVALYLLGFAFALSSRLQERAATKREIAETAAFSTSAERLASLAKRSRALREVVEQVQSDFDNETDCLSSEQVVMVDLVAVLRWLTRDDEVVEEDARTLRCFCFHAYITDLADTDQELAERIRQMDVKEELVSLQMLRRVDAGDLQELRGAFLEVAEEAGKRSGRPLGARGQATNHVVTTIENDYLTPREEMARFATSAEEFLETLSQAADRGGAREHYKLFSVEPTCTDSELRSAYREKLTEWHPDRLGTMPVELQELATRRTAELNLAYAALCEARSA